MMLNQLMGMRLLTSNKILPHFSRHHHTILPGILQGLSRCKMRRDRLNLHGSQRLQAVTGTVFLPCPKKVLTLVMPLMMTSRFDLYN
jgi:hypothetical protein